MSEFKKGDRFWTCSMPIMVKHTLDRIEGDRYYSITQTISHNKSSVFKSKNAAIDALIERIRLLKDE